jgi:predicted RecB family nuclease
VWGAIIGKEKQLVWRELSDEMHMRFDVAQLTRRKMSAMDIYAQEWEWRIQVAQAAADPNAEALASPEKCSECSSCEWRTYCHDVMEDVDHITLLQGVTPTKAQPHYAAGVFTRHHLALLDWDTAAALEAGVPVAAMLAKVANHDSKDPADVLADNAAERKALTKAGLTTVGQVAKLDDYTAQLYANAERPAGITAAIDAARVAKAGKVHLARGVKALDIPRFDVELDVDMENETTKGLIYMWGTRLEVHKRGVPLYANDGEYKAFTTWGVDDTDGEAQAFADLWSFLGGLILVTHLAGLSFGAWCYTGAEARCMRSLARKHVGYPGAPTPDQVEAFLASPYWVDLYDVVNNQLVWPTEDLSLKTVAKWARHSWRDSDASGDASTVWYRDAVGDPDPEVRGSAQTRLLEYNEDDVIATAVLRRWLRSLMRARKVDNRIPPVSTLKSRWKQRRTAAVRRLVVRS